MELKEILEKNTEMLKGMGASVDTIVDANKDLETRIKDLETRMTPRRVSLPGLEDEAKNFSLIRAIRAIVTRDWSNAGFERDVFEQARKRTAMSMATDTSMGYFVPNEILAGYIELFRAESVLLKLGATNLDGLVGNPVSVPKQTGGATTYWVGENESITESSETAAQVNLTPKKVAALVKLSNELLKFSNPSIETMIRSDVTIAIALAIDLAGLRGSGASHEPRGIANTPGINTVAIGTNGGAPTFDLLYDMQYELQVDNAFRGKMGFCFHPATRRRLLKTKVAQFSADTGGDYIIQPMVSDAQLVNWMGFPYQMTTQIPITLTKGSSTNCTEIYFANWPELLMGQWGGFELKVSQETSTAFEKDQTWIRVIQEVDVQVRHAESFCLISDATIA